VLLHANRSHEASTFTTNVPGCLLIGALTGTGERLGVDPTTVLNRLRECGIRIRDTHGRPRS
jgi:fluoride ion exporter CrcB/FEX